MFATRRRKVCKVDFAFVALAQMIPMKKSELQQRKVDDLIPYAKNARTHSDRQISQLVKNIKKFGFYNPVLIDENDNVIAGHGRIMAAKKMKMVEVPAMVMFGLSESERRALIIADNKLSLNSAWDMDLIREELSDLSKLDYDMNLTGFDNHEIEALLRDDLDILPIDIDSTFTASPQERPKVERQSKNREAPATGRKTVEVDLSLEDHAKLIELLDDLVAEKHFDSRGAALMLLVDFWEDKE